MNKLQRWEGNIQHDLPSLEQLDVTGSSHLVPRENLLQLSTLKELHGVSIQKKCSSCSLIKNVTINSNSGKHRCEGSDEVLKVICTKCNPMKCSCVTHYFSNTSVTFSQYGFVIAKCKNRGKCRKFLSTKIITNPCMRRHLTIFAIVHIPVGIAGIVANTIAVVVIFTTQSLHKNVSLLLAANMAFSDLLMCIYAVSIVTIHLTISYDSFIRNIRSVCLPSGFLWFTSLSVSTCTSTLITIERFLAVFFVMNLSRRLRKTHASFCLLGIWLFTLGFAVFAVIKEYSTHNSFCVPGSSVAGSPKHMRFMTSFGCIAVMLSLTTIILYILIFITARRSSKAMKAKREFKMALRISILVFSNMACFILPVFINLILAFTGTYPKGVQVDGSGSVLKMALAMYIPSFCFNLNSLLNPLWYIFRNDKFKAVLKQRFCQIYHKMFGNCHKKNTVEHAIFYVEPDTEIKSLSRNKSETTF